MDLRKILGNIENHEELIKQIEDAVGKDYVPRTEFNTKNTELKTTQKELEDTRASLETLEKEKSTYETKVADLHAKITGYESAALKARIAHEVGLPYELAARLSGDDEDAIRSDAEILQGLLGGKEAPPLKDAEASLPSGDDASYKALLSEIKGE